MIYDEFKDRVGDIVRGVVRRFERSDVVIDLGRYEATLPSRERVPIEEYQPGEQLRCLSKPWKKPAAARRLCFPVPLLNLS